MEKKLTRIDGSQWIVATIKLTDGRLSITGSMGSIVTLATAKKMALQTWIDYFEDQPTEIASMRARCPDFNGRTATAAARYVVKIDGAYHGIDVDRFDGNRAFLVDSCGCIHNEIVRAFPQLATAIPYHLNDLRAECKHQRARGETYNKDPNAICPDCGYKIGSRWLTLTIPDSVIALLNSIE